MHFFIFKRKDGLEVPSFQIGSIKEKPIIPRATRIMKSISIEGRNGTLTEDTKSYSDIEISFELINYKVNLWQSETIGLLDGTGGELHLSWIEGWYKVNEVNLSIKEDITGLFNIIITFKCGPFRQLEKSQFTFTQNNSNILIQGNYEADHITKIYGNGDISLFINDEQIIFKNVEEYITLDTARFICYKDNQNKKMIGEYIKLKPQLNNIRWIGNVTKVEMSYRGRFLN
ncbi:hypothetical protein PMY56_13655 [Clostridium tertium]|uniref:hypothetical protein n=1 Tax=Clostridium tertium TaxID=1559 RepID=UPI00232E2C8B|nr:hypothetical protein [Clostridium tertium]MDB1924056.1 hypothetical protein [Clostridium tertium]MDB1927183.1 hypothetical protein [Clostridium tertium]MDB1930960.1 hypothetical protein [Clostridium tertium]